MVEYAKTLVINDAPVKPGTIRRYVPADYPEFSSDEEESPETSRIGGNFRPLACDNEKLTGQPITPQLSWADTYPELASKSSGGLVKDLQVVKAYKKDLAKSRKAEDIGEKTLKELKRKSFLLILKFIRSSNYFIRKIR